MNYNLAAICVSELYGQCGILNISQPYMPPQPYFLLYPVLLITNLKIILQFAVYPNVATVKPKERLWVCLCNSLWLRGSFTVPTAMNSCWSHCFLCSPCRIKET
jgi:hypothetical protein